MAPTKPSKRGSIRDKIARKSSETSSTVSHPARASISAIQPTKKDKRDARHHALLSKVESSAAITKASRKNLKRSIARSTAQNLSANLHSLADALPDANDPLKEFLVSEGLDQKQSAATTDGVTSGKMKLKTLKSKPGAQKRKEKILKDECSRFVQNLAIIQTAVTQPDQSTNAATPVAIPSVWSALRSHIAHNMEKKEDFVKMDAAAKVASDNRMLVD